MNLHVIRVLTYPSVTLSDVRSLPKEPGVYYAVKGLKVLYVGESVNINKRWSGHHGQKQPLTLLKGVKLHYRVTPKHRTEYEEAKEIQLFHPPLNKQFPKPDNYRTLRIQLGDYFVFCRNSAIILFALFIASYTVQSRPNQTTPRQILDSEITRP